MNYTFTLHGQIKIEANGELEAVEKLMDTFQLNVEKYVEIENE